MTRLANRLLDLAFLPLLEPYWRRRLRGQVLCLLYHRVDQAGRQPFLDAGGSPVVSPAGLERDVAFWVGRGARFVTFRDLRDGRLPGVDEVGVAVCFDDGFADTYRQGLPVLERHGVAGTVFQITSIVGSRRLLWEHRLYRALFDGHAREPLLRRAREVLEDESLAEREILDHLRFRLGRAALASLLEEVGEIDGEAELAGAIYPDESTLRAAAGRGHEIGSHGHEHRARGTLSGDEFELELTRSRDELAAILGSPPEAYSHPFGEHEPDDPERLRCHYRQAAIVDPRPISQGDSPFELPRCSWPGPARNRLRWRRWLLTGRI